MTEAHLADFLEDRLGGKQDQAPPVLAKLVDEQLSQTCPQDQETSAGVTAGHLGSWSGGRRLLASCCLGLSRRRWLERLVRCWESVHSWYWWQESSSPRWSSHTLYWLLVPEDRIPGGVLMLLVGHLLLTQAHHLASVGESHPTLSAASPTPVPADHVPAGGIVSSQDTQEDTPDQGLSPEVVEDEMTPECRHPGHRLHVPGVQAGQDMHLFKYVSARLHLPQLCSYSFSCLPASPGCVCSPCPAEDQGCPPSFPAVHITTSSGSTTSKALGPNLL